MANPSAPRNAGYGTPGGVRGPEGYGTPAAPPARPASGYPTQDAYRVADSYTRPANSDDGWDAPTHVSTGGRRGQPAEPPLMPPVRPEPDRTIAFSDIHGALDARAGVAARRRNRSGGRERGLPGWAAVLVLMAIAGAGGIIDLARGAAVKGGFNIALVVASVVAILVVRRRAMFPVVVAPPLVYFVASAVMLYTRTDGLSNRSRMLDAAINWLVYGFPAIAGATAAVLIIAGIRLISGK